jgi:raffinose/stachyose/melibiose transport system permease protein
LLGKKIAFGRQKMVLLISFLFIPTILLILFVVYPLIKLGEFSFTDWNGTSKTYNYIGLENFIDIFTKFPEVWVSLKNNALYFFIHLFLIPFEIYIAYLLSRAVRGSGFMKKFILLPYIINGVAVSYMFSTFFAPTYANGALNIIMEAIGLEPLIQDWLGDPNIVNYSLVFVSVWRFSGFHILIFFAGIQSIPGELIEAAKIDGAGELTIFSQIVIPDIVLVIEIVLFLNVKGALQVFDIPFVMTYGGPGHASSTFTLYTIQMAFRYNRFGTASAMAVILFFLIIIIAFAQQWIFKRYLRT